MIFEIVWYVMRVQYILLFDIIHAYVFIYIYVNACMYFMVH